MGIRWGGIDQKKSARVIDLKRNEIECLEQDFSDENFELEEKDMMNAFTPSEKRDEPILEKKRSQFSQSHR